MRNCWWGSLHQTGSRKTTGNRWTLEVLSHNFGPASRRALLDEDLRAALDRAEAGFVHTRKSETEKLLNFEAFREFGEQIKDHVLQHLDHYLLEFEKNVVKNGGHVHWANNGEEANQQILGICKRANARKIAKGKSMVSEEAATNRSLEARGYEVVETDLGEYIIQLAKESPSHIIAPALHKSKQNVIDLFHAHHAKLGYGEKVMERTGIVSQARQVLRDHFCSADVGITGSNFLVAETGSAVIVTNEGNGDLSSSLPRVHIVVASMEKVIPDLESLGGFLRLLGRSATGQVMTVYTSVFNGPKRARDLDGPEEFHVILLDNGRSGILGSAYQDILRCIRCGACMNHCPVYTSIGGHAYGWVYPGPMGSVLTPLLVGRDKAADLPYACSLNGRCETVCPVKIPLPSLLRKHRAELTESNHISRQSKFWMWMWYQLAVSPRLYQKVANFLGQVLYWGKKCMPRDKRGRFGWMPLAGPWVASRDLPAPSRKTFQKQWKDANLKTRP